MAAFKDFYLSLSAEDRITYAAKAGTTPGYCNKLIYGGAKVELGLADVMVAASGGKLDHSALPMTDRAIAQMRARELLTKETA